MNNISEKKIIFIFIAALLLIGLVLSRRYFTWFEETEITAVTPIGGVVCGGPAKVKCQSRYVCQYEVVGGKQTDTGFCMLR